MITNNEFYLTQITWPSFAYFIKLIILPDSFRYLVYLLKVAAH